MSDKEDAFVKGVQAYDAYQSREDNPYEETNFSYFIWACGYNDRKNGYVDEEGWVISDDRS